jgi:hypothetical protein
VTLTVRSATVSGATTKGSALTHAELDENFNHLSQASNHTFTPSGTGTVATNAAEKIGRIVDVFDYLTAAEKTAVLARTFATDVSASVKAAAADMGDNDTLYFPPGGYLLDSETASYPHTAAANQHVFVLNGLDNAHIIGYGAVVKQTTKNNTVFGAFCLYDCNWSSVRGFHWIGNGGITATDLNNWTNAAVGITGDSEGCSVDITMEGGGWAPAFIFERQNDGTGTAADRPRKTFVRASTNQVRYGIEYSHVARGHTFDIRTEDALRSVFLAGHGAGITGVLSSENCESADLFINPKNSSTLEDVDITIHRKASTQPGVSIQNAAATACTVRRVRIRGEVASTNSIGVSISTTPLGSTSSVIEDIDLSDLYVETSASTGGRGVYIDPDVAGTIRRITLPRRIKSLGNNVEIENTSAATMSDIVVPDGFFWEFQASSTGEGLRVTGGTVSRVVVGDGGTFDGTNTTASNMINMTTAAGVTLGKFRATNSKFIGLAGCTGVSPANFDIGGYGFVHHGTLANASNIIGQETILLTSGNPTYTSFARVIPGQMVRFVSLGATPTFTDGTNLVMAGGANFTMASGDSITFICGDDPDSGPVATSTLYEVCRSDNTP